MKKKTILTHTMTFVMGILSVTPLFAQDATGIEIDTANFADTTKYLEEVIMDKANETVQRKTFFEEVYWWCFTEFITSITHNEPMSFDRIYNRVLESPGRSSLKVFLTSVFASFEFIDDGTERNILSEAISSQNADAFIELYEKLNNTDKQKLLEQTFSCLKIKADWEENYSKLLNHFRKDQYKK